MPDSEKIVRAILSELDDRKGFDEWWHGIDEETRNEIVSDLADTVENVLEEDSE